MTQQTAVEWLDSKLDDLLILHPSEWEKVNEVIEQAKQMEKVQILDAWEDGAQSEHRAHVNDKADKSSLDYYNETYKQQ